ncbi:MULTISPECIES: prepilin-type N-terminal cleavage/methylation domain-containing protein [unclassified Clostridium]|uniref:prepilin-type N-terminal cleavage/methylation domain-containing protein n=1 Tax=unclassified Clostridium TaxID=2614128 RepID=UPI002079DCCB|nr:MULTISPECIES: prepilin-type N-terminal cleavage/methylation domain-containing protein [unclassified Clostridium]
MNTLSIKSMSNQISKKKKTGFTLVELIIVIAIIAILAAMAIPKFGEVRGDAKISNDIAAAKNIQSTVSMLIANGTIKEDTLKADKGLKIEDGTEVAKRIDGKVIPSAMSGNFIAEMDKDGNISILVGDTKLAPADETTTQKYKTAVDESKKK